MYRLLHQIVLRKQSLATCFMNVNNVKSIHSKSSLSPMCQTRLAGSFVRGCARRHTSSVVKQTCDCASTATSSVTCTASTCEQKLKVGSLELNYLTVGSGPHAVLCLPGALGTIWTDFKPQIEGLDHNAFTVVVWDPPGYGRSRPPDRDFPKDFFRRDAECAANLMQALNLVQYSLLGWSDGGITALILAAKQRNSINKLIVWGANSYVTQQDAKLYKGIRDTSQWSPKMRDAMVDVYGKDYFERTWTAWVDAMVHIADTGGDICKADLQHITAQTLVIHGAKDPLVPAFHPDYLVNNIRGAKLHIFEEGRHNLHIRYAPEFNQLVNNFLRGLNSSL